MWSTQYLGEYNEEWHWMLDLNLMKFNRRSFSGDAQKSSFWWAQFVASSILPLCIFPSSSSSLSSSLFNAQSHTFRWEWVKPRSLFFSCLFVVSVPVWESLSHFQSYLQSLQSKKVPPTSLTGDDSVSMLHGSDQLANLCARNNVPESAHTTLSHVP